MSLSQLPRSSRCIFLEQFIPDLSVIDDYEISQSLEDFAFGKDSFSMDDTAFFQDGGHPLDDDDDNDGIGGVGDTSQFSNAMDVDGTSGSAAPVEDFFVGDQAIADDYADFGAGYGGDGDEIQEDVGGDGDLDVAGCCTSTYLLDCRHENEGAPVSRGRLRSEMCGGGGSASLNLYGAGYTHCRRARQRRSWSGGVVARKRGLPQCDSHTVDTMLVSACPAAAALALH